MTRSTDVYNLSVDQPAALEAALEAIRGGHCVVLPTDTVYGIGANAFDPQAVQGLLDAKERGRDMPPPVLIAEPSMLRAVADEVPEGARKLAQALWPGALTLVLKAQAGSGMDLGETGGTIAVRVPDHDDARALLRRTGPLAVSSANVSGQAAALTCQEAEEQLGDRVAVYLDGGPVSGAVPSTIVDFASSDTGLVLRMGAISLETLLTHAESVEIYAPPDERASTQEVLAEEQTPPSDDEMERASTETVASNVPSDATPDDRTQP